MASDLQSSALLLVAAAELNLVKGVIDAIRTADLSSAKGCGPGSGCTERPTDRFEPRTVLHPTPEYLPRPVIHPTPTYLPRPVLHPEPRVEPEPAIQGSPAHKPFVIQPPWKTLPFPHAHAAAVKVKSFIQSSDTHKGLLIDFFC